MAKTKAYTVNIDSNTTEEMQQVIEKESEKTIQETIDPIILKLRFAAEKYLGEVERLQESIGRFERVLKHQKSLRHKSSLSKQNADSYTQNKEEIKMFLRSRVPQELYTSAFEFQNVLNEALEQKIKMIYVYENEEGNPELYEITSEDILTFGYSSKGKLTGRYGAIKDASNNLKSGVERLVLDEELKFSRTGLDTTYKEVLSRYRTSRGAKKRIVVWEYPKDRWQGMSVVSEGDIHESYAGVIILNRPNPTFKNGLEQNIGDFMDFVAKVDNISGMLEGDITKNNIEYGIKSAGASTLGLKQMQALAQEILADANFDKEKLQKVQKKLHDKGRTRNKRLLESIVEKDCEDIIKSIRQS